MSAWTPEHINDLSSHTIVITGANSGIGFEAAKVLAHAGATVILACRNLDKARNAAAAIRASHSASSLLLCRLDLADLTSVRQCAHDITGQVEHIDILINNAGIMAVPWMMTNDGFERQIGTNHFGHFALTAQLFPTLLRAPAPRVVTVASNAHKAGRIQFDALSDANRYSKFGAYAQSKLANLLFMRELHHRYAGTVPSFRSVACHPGYSDTKLPFGGVSGSNSALANQILRIGGTYVAQTAEAGAWTTLYAATADIPSGSYVGPSGPFEMWGPPTLVQPSRRARDRDTAARLWTLSEQATGTIYPA